MLEFNMHITIETLWKQGKNKSEISRITGHDWKTVSKVTKAIKSGGYPVKKPHPKILSTYHDKILEFLELLFEDETNTRRDNSHTKRYIKAKLPSHKTTEEFDFSFQPSIDKKLINDALICQFIKEKKNVIFIGNPGTGKTHLSISLGIQALHKGFKVLFTSVAEMLYNLNISKADNSYYKKLEYYLEPNLLILDELGFKKLPNYSADDFFEIISKRYEKGSIIITTNKSVEQWSDIFADNILASAILDRIVHHSILFKINGPSYRSKNSKNSHNEK